jgi:hypothetical protein
MMLFGNTLRGSHAQDAGKAVKLPGSALRVARFRVRRYKRIDAFLKPRCAARPESMVQ